LKKNRTFLHALLLLPLAVHAFSNRPAHDFTAVGSPIPAAPADPAIRHALNQISSAEIKQTIGTLVGFKNRSTLGPGAVAASAWIEAQFQQDSKACGGCLEVKRDTFTEKPQDRIPQPTVISNVYAILRGKDPLQSKRMFLVTGHYDSRNSTNENTTDQAPGANDDASGVAVSLACARVLSKMQFPATLVFVAVAGEEQGLNGSRHLAQFARSQGWELEGVLNNDIVGGDTTPGDNFEDKSLVRVFSEQGADNDSSSRQLARAVVAAARTYLQPFRPVLEFRQDRFGRGGDHRSFNQEGFAAVRMTEWRENYNHQHQDVRVENGVQYGDLLQYVDFAYTADVARLNAATLGTLASAPPAPAEVKMSIASQDNSSALSWSGPEGTTYQVLWRETSAPDWQYFTTVQGNAIKLPVSHDNVIFGVRAVDQAGHASLAVTPVAAR
jgi:hypothetical protein